MGFMAEKIKIALGYRGLRPWTRHSLVLLVAGMVYVAIGLTYMLGGTNSARASSMRLQLEWIPIQAWGALFILTGAASIISSRWPPASATWGYTSMTGLSAAWALFYLGGMIPRYWDFWIFNGDLGAGLGAPVQNFSAVLSWGLIAFLWWAVSGLVNPVSQRQRVVIITLDADNNPSHVESFDMTRESGLMQDEEPIL